MNKRFYRHKFANVINVQKIVTIHYQKINQNYISKTEKHGFWEINYVDKGSVTVFIEDKPISINAGELLFIPPNKKHYLKSGNFEPNVFIISFTCTSQSMELFYNEKYVVGEGLIYLLQNIMSEAEKTFNIPDFNPDLNKLELKEAPSFGGEQVIKNSLELLLVYMLRSTSEANFPTEFFYSKTISSNNLEDEIVRILNSKLYGTFKLNDVCEVIHYGKTFICTEFRKKTGMSVYKTYLKLKTDEAKKLIRNGLTFSNISQALCFDSVAHFNDTFKKFTGMTPGEYKQSIK